MLGICVTRVAALIVELSPESLGAISNVGGNRTFDQISFVREAKFPSPGHGV